MTLDDQVCTIEQGEEIANLGLDLKTTFCHCKIADYEKLFYKSPYQVLPTSLVEGFELAEYIAPAFNVSELASLLPARIYYEGQDFFMAMHKGKNGWYIEYLTGNKDVVVTADGEFAMPRNALFMTYRSEYNMAKAMASYLILLLKNNLIDLEQIKTYNL